tara:strand:+ start:1018 stop:2289 length:1272 start_codon:yes stop_codon:yes gene_type:complete
MSLKFTNILSGVILEQSRYEVLVNKFAKAKKKASGKTIKPKIPLETLRLLMLADPTTRPGEGTDIDDGEIKKVGAYSQWLIKQWMSLQQEADKAYAYGSNEWGVKLEQLQATFLEDLYKTTEDLQKFNRFKSQLPQEKRDINRIASTDELYELTKQFSLEQATTTKAERVLQDAEMVYDGPNWEILIPKSRDAACHYGSNTRWCTAGSSNNYYDHYSKQGPLYIITNKKDHTDKYQFHFESNQFMDKEDRNVSLSPFLNDRPELKEFFKEMFKRFLDKDQQHGKRVQVRYPNDNVSKYIGIYGFDEFMESLPQDMVRFDFESGGGYGNQDKLASRPLPEKFTTFPDLQILHIEGLVNEIPESIGNLKKLKFLSLAKNPDLKSLPDSLADIDTLEVVNIKDSPNVKIGPRLQEKDDNEEIIIIR